MIGDYPILDEIAGMIRNIQPTRSNAIPKPKRIFSNVMAGVTVVLWDDGTKTIVKLCKGDHYDPYAAFCAAFAKKCYGSNSALKREIENLTVHQGISRDRCDDVIDAICKVGLENHVQTAPESKDMARRIHEWYLR